MCSLCFGNGIKDGKAQNFLSPFSRGNACDKLGAIHEALLCMKASGLAGDALCNHTRFFAYQDGHTYFLPFKAATDFCAASLSVSAVVIGRPDSWRSFFPCSTWVPSMRTTSGTC